MTDSGLSPVPLSPPHSPSHSLPIACVLSIALSSSTPLLPSCLQSPTLVSCVLSALSAVPSLPLSPALVLSAPLLPPIAHSLICCTCCQYYHCPFYLLFHFLFSLCSHCPCCPHHWYLFPPHFVHHSCHSFPLCPIDLQYQLESQWLQQTNTPFLP